MVKQKVYFGWLHRKDKKTKAKQVKGEGGVRTQEFVGETLTVDFLVNHGKKLFFPGGISRKGSITNMDCELGFYSEVITEFKDVNGEPCTFDMYLKSFGMFASRRIVYLITTEKSTSTVEDNSAKETPQIRMTEKTSPEIGEDSAMETPSQCNTDCPFEPRSEFSVWCGGTKLPEVELDVHYTLAKESKYTEALSYISLDSKASCYEYMVLTDPDVKDAGMLDFDPLENGFTITKIKNENTTYLDSCLPKTSMSVPLKHGIVYGPDVIYGKEGTSHDLVLGCVANVNSQATYTWYRDGLPIGSGCKKIAIYPKQEGLYFCEVRNGKRSFSSNPVHVRKEPTGSIKDLQPETNAFVEHGELNLDKPDDFLKENEFSIDTREIIGEGAYGKVYKGDLHGTTVAVKKLKLKRAATMQKVVKQEMLIHRTLKHPNIVTFLGASIGKDNLYIISEYVDGGNLEDVLFDPETQQIFPSLTNHSKNNIAVHISQAVTYMHNRCPKIIHCDVKPANVLVSKKFDIAKLCDLGISKVRSIEKTLTTACRGVLPGTPQYTAPEVMLHNKKTSTATDIWSLGCTLNELYTGKECWAAYDLKMDSDSNSSDDNSIYSLKQYMTEALSPWCSLEGLHTNVIEVIKGCLSYDPTKRLDGLTVTEMLKSTY